MSLQQRFDAAARFLGVPIRSANDAALGLVAMTEIAQEQRTQIAALTQRVEALETAQPKSFPGRALTAAARIFS